MKGSIRRSLSLLEKCINMNHLKQAHAQLLTCGLGNSSFPLSRLLAFCADPHYGCLSHASNLFQRIQHPTLCICNTMIKAFFLRGEHFDAIVILSKMLRNGINPDNYTFPYVLKACSKINNDSGLGESLHCCSLKLGFVLDVFVGNSLIAMYSAFDNLKAAGYVFDEIPKSCAASWTVMICAYAKMGNVDTARWLFDMAPIQDLGIWGAMISGYVQNNCFKEGLHMFRLMQLTNIEPDESIFVTILCACAHMGALDTGIWIHRYLNRLGLRLGMRLSTGLIDMYAKCGNLDIAKYLFDEMPQRDTVCWNAMISGMTTHGNGGEALKLFSAMEEAGFRPDDITFIAVLAACCNAGFTYEGLRVLNKMRTLYKIEPKAEHYGCVVDLLSRAGHFQEAKEIIEGRLNAASPSEKAVAWRAFLDGCCKHGETQQAEIAADRLFDLENHSGAYVLLSNLYAALGKHWEARRVRKLMRLRGVEKEQGCSSIKVNGIVNEFIAGEKTHLQLEIIHAVLEEMNKQITQLADHEAISMAML